MVRITILKPGPLLTVQDAGRTGAGSLGVPPAGAADPMAFRAANLLAGNPANAPALEVLLGGASIRFEARCIAAVTGAAAICRRDAETIALDRSHWFEAGQTLSLSFPDSGARNYIAVQGGFSVARVLGSASTDVTSGIGGRPLRAGDMLAIRSGTGNGVLLGWTARAPYRRTLRVTPGPQASWFPLDSLLAGVYRVLPDSSRMGIRLDGPPLLLAEPRELITEPVACGALQVPPSGQPILLFVEQPVTGGYPKIASVITADFPSVGQLRPGDEVRFAAVTWDDARKALLDEERRIAGEAFQII